MLSVTVVLLPPSPHRNSGGFDYDAPYELRALEVALAACTNALDSEVYDLELRAYPAIGRTQVGHRHWSTE